MQHVQLRLYFRPCAQGIEVVGICGDNGVQSIQRFDGLPHLEEDESLEQPCVDVVGAQAKVLQQLGFCFDKAVGGIVACGADEVSACFHLTRDFLVRFEHLLGIFDRLGVFAVLKIGFASGKSCIDIVGMFLEDVGQRLLRLFAFSARHFYQCEIIAQHVVAGCIGAQFDGAFQILFRFVE